MLYFRYRKKLIWPIKKMLKYFFKNDYTNTNHEIEEIATSENGKDQNIFQSYQCNS